MPVHICQHTSDALNQGGGSVSEGQQFGNSVPFLQKSYFAAGGVYWPIAAFILVEHVLLLRLIDG